jgi:5'-phosphate synthase pdxT subunit
MVMSQAVIGVLDLQGDVREHLSAIEMSGGRALSIKLPLSLKEIDGLIIPGGESTTISKLMAIYGFFDAINLFILNGGAVYGTCAGTILLAKNIVGNGLPTLGLLDMQVERNAYGRQVDSFEEEIRIKEMDQDPFRAVFIRAPIIRETGPDVSIMASLNGYPVMVRKDDILATTFHPELSSDSRVHKYFIKMAKGVG